MKVSDTQDPALRTYTLKESRAATMSRHPVISRALACGVATVAVAALGLVPAVAAARTPSATRLPAASWALRAIVRGGQDYALSGKTLLVNAVDGRDVYVFNDGPTGWRQVAELEKPSDLSKNTAFGVGAISGDVAVLPAPEAHNGQGRAYVFSSSGGTWHQVQELESPHPISNGGQFGSGVDISGGTIVVGANDCNVGAHFNHWFSCVFVFTKSATGWRESAMLTGGPGVNLFGPVISGSTVAAAAGEFSNKSWVDVFAGTTGGWRQVAKLVGSGQVPDDEFGITLDISGSSIFVGAPGDCNDVEYNPATGPSRVYVFSGGAGGWHQVAELFGEGTTICDDFAGSIAAAGNTLVVGADDAYSSGPGEVFVFTGGPGGWHQGALLQSPDPSEGSFGQVVAVSGGVIVVGAPWYGCPPGAATSLVCEGRTYVYGYGTSPSGSSSGSSGTSPGGPPGPPAGGPAGGSSGGTGSGSVRFSTVGHYLLPSPLGKAMCHAQRFDDGSVQAQIAVYGATCTEATSVLGPGADEAKGASYRSAGFSCEATAEGAGSEWASAWAGTYYAYSCADGAAQAAFNWGTGYLR